MIITENGMTIRLAVNSVRLMGRTAQGVKLINLKENSKIASVTRVPQSEEITEEKNSDEISEQTNE